MIFVAGAMKMDPTVALEFQRDVKSVIEQVRAEEGCHHYSVLVEDASKGIVNVHEIWEDDAALKKHLSQPWVHEFNRYSPHLVSHTLQIYDIAGTRPLPSPGGE